MTQSEGNILEFAGAGQPIDLQSGFCPGQGADRLCTDFWRTPRHQAHHLVTGRIFGGQLAHMRTIAQNGNPVRKPSDLFQPVRDVEGRAPFAGKGLDIAQQHLLTVGQRGCRLIENDDAGFGRGGTGDLHELLLRF